MGWNSSCPFVERLRVIVTEFQIDAFCGTGPLRFVDLGSGLNVVLARTDAAARELLHVIPGTLFGDGRYFTLASSLALSETLRTSLMVRTEDGVFRIERRWDDPQRSLRVTCSDHSELEIGVWRQRFGQMAPEDYAREFTWGAARLERLARNPGRALANLSQFSRRLLDKTAPLSEAVEATAPHSIHDPRRWERIKALLTEVQTLVQAQALSAESARGTDHDSQAAERDRVSVQLRKADAAQRQLRDQWKQGELEWEQIQAFLAVSGLREQIAEAGKALEALDREDARSDLEIDHPASWDRLNEKLTNAQEDIRQIQQERRETQAQLQELAKYQKTDQLRPSLESLLSQEKLLLKEEDALEQLRSRIEDLQDRAHTQRLEAVVRPVAANDLAIAPQTLARLDTLSERMRDTEREVEIADQRLGRAEALAVAATPPKATAAAPVDSLAIHEAETRVAKLRDQLGWKDEQTQLLRKRNDLEEETRHLYASQMLPMGAMLLFGLPFAVGVAMILHALMMRGTNLAWPQVLWGFLLAIASVVIKMIRDHDRSELLIATRRKLSRVNELLEQGGGGSRAEDAALSAQLRAAEQDLEELHRQFAEPTRDKESASASSSSNLEGARRAAKEVKDRLRELHQHWRELLKDLNLPATLSPAHAKEALASRDLQAQTRTEPEGASHDWQVQSLRQELDRRREWLAHQVHPIRQIAKEVEPSSTDSSLVSHLDVLRDAIRDARERDQTRRHVQRVASRLRQKYRSTRRNVRRLTDERRSMEETLRRKKEQRQEHATRQADQRRTLEERRLRHERELQTWLDRLALGPSSPWWDSPAADLLARQSQQREKVEATREQLMAAVEHRARLQAELDREPPSAQPGSWDVRPILEKFQELETAFQEVDTATPPPPTTTFPSVGADAAGNLSHVARYLDPLTDGQWVDLRWNHGLFVKGRFGAWVSLEQVDPRHLANVYFALWLARVEQRASLGIRFPVIMQDPLEFTPPRRKADVARLLREFAAAGHQILLVTARRRHAGVFARMGVPIADLSQREEDWQSVHPAWSNGHQLGNGRDAAGFVSNAEPVADGS